MTAWYSWTWIERNAESVSVDRRADYGREFASIVQGPGPHSSTRGRRRVRQGPVKAGIRFRHRDPRAYVRSATFDTDSLPVDLVTSDLRVTWKRVDLAGPGRAAADAGLQDVAPGGL